MSLYARLCGWRLRHLAVATFRLLVRRWYALVFLLLLLSPGGMPPREQLRLVGAPVLQMLEADHAARSIGLWSAMLLIAWSWSALHAQALSGAHPWHHLATMPIAPRLLQGVDLTVLAIADLPLWLPFVAAAVSLAVGRPPAAAPIASVLALACQLPAVQYLALRRSRALAWCLVGSCAGFAATAATGQPWLLCVATIAGTAAGLAAGAGVSARPATATRRPWLTLRAHWPPRLQLAVIALRFLFGPGALGRNFGLFLTVALPPPLFEFLRSGGVQAPVVSVALLLLLPSLLFRVSALALDLKRLHLPMERVHMALGVTPVALFRASLFVLAIVFAIASLPLALTLWRATDSPGTLATLPIGTAAMVTMAWLDRAGSPRRFVARALVAVLACLAVYALL